MSLVELKGISKIYDISRKNERVIFKNLDLSIEKGEYVAIVGRSGSGKSTLLNIIGQIDNVTSGDYIYNGVSIQKYNDREKSRFRATEIGFIFQDFALLENDSVKNNLNLPSLFSKTKTKKNMEEILDILDIKHLLREKCSKLSGGEKQRVAIARALVNDPNVILADEPTGALDQENAMGVMKILDLINKSGKTVIIVTHDSEVANRASRIVRM